MKRKYLIGILMLLGSPVIFGQVNQKSNMYSNQTTQVENISDINVELNTNDFYKEQSFIWNDNALKNKQDAAAWYNYYKASRFSFSTLDNIMIPEIYQKELDKIVEAMGENVPSSYEYNYVKFWNSNYDPELFHFLEKAYKLRPESTELYDDFVAYYEMTAEPVKKKEFCEKWYEMDAFPQDLYDYNYNLLMSLEKNAILVTNGFNDTYPLWILQEVLAVRPDVSLLNIKLLGNIDYRSRKMEELDLLITNRSDYNLYPEEYFRNLCTNNPEKDIYFSMTVPVKIFRTMLNQLYPTGLALKYSVADFDNVEKIRNAWEMNFRKGHIEEPTSRCNVNVLNKNYIIALSLLENYYRENGQADKANDIKRIMENILTKAIE